MAGVYIHIPYCLRKCAYCGFYSKAVAKDTEREVSLKPYVNALIKEIQFRKDEIDEPVETVYFGGGTPSLLPVKMLVDIFEVLRKSFTLVENPEITFEGNPENLTKEYVSDIRKYTPINRLSIGVQSFFDEDTRYLNRKHSAKRSIECIEDAIAAGFERLSIDLIYALPELTDERWLKNLEIFCSLDVSHLSAYALTIEPNTLLDKQIRKGLTAAPSDELAERHYLLTREYLENRGFQAYETSNFCKNRHYSKHNSNYWNLSKYYGFGASAHSFSGTSRSWNISDADAYITAIQNGEILRETELSTKETLYNEYVMTAIRTQWGISEDFILSHFGQSFLTHFQQCLQKIPQDQITISNKHVSTTQKGALFADALAFGMFV